MQTVRGELRAGAGQAGGGCRCGAELGDAVRGGHSVGGGCGAGRFGGIGCDAVQCGAGPLVPFLGCRC